MPYATQQDLVDRFGEAELIQLTDRDNVGAIDATAVSRALADADAKIDSHIGTRYALPLVVAQPALVPVACAIARLHLYGNRVTEDVRTAYRDAERFLESVATGKARLDAQAVSLGTREAEVTEPTRPRVFGGGLG
jgi:phage gp36-like protein